MDNLENMKFWFVQFKHEDIIMFENDLKKYCDRYVIGQEVCKGAHKETNGEHYHVAADISQENYTKYKNAIYNKKYKLRGQAKDGKPKQYGQVSDVRDKTRMMSYTLKDNKIVYNNITLEELQQYIDDAYPKVDHWEIQILDMLKLHDINVEPQELYNKIQDYEHIMDVANRLQFQISCLILKFYIDNSKQQAVPSRAYIKKLTLKYLMYNTKIDIPILNILI